MEFPYMPHWVPPLNIILHWIWTMCYNQLTNIDTFDKVHILFRFSKVYVHLFSGPGSHPGYDITFSRHVYLDSSWLWVFLRLSLLLITLTVLKCIDQVFCRISHTWDLSGAFFMIILRLCVFERKILDIKCHFHHIIARIHTIRMTLHHCYWLFITWMK